MPLGSLLEWSKDRPIWQQDALRRLAVSGELSEADLLELKTAIERAAGLQVQTKPELSPLTEEHLRPVISANEETVLASLGPVRNVGRLAPDQPPIRFSVKGVTVVYGANGSGKSGYCRIAKLLCGSRAADPLRSNIYEPPPAEPPTAMVGYRVGAGDQPKTETSWVSGTTPPKELSKIAVFDTDNASVYVDKDRNIDFLPYELDLLNKLGIACIDLEKSFKSQVDLLTEGLAVKLPEGFHAGSAVEKLLRNITEADDLESLPSEEEIRECGLWSEAQQNELDEKNDKLAGDPLVLARNRETAASALRSVHGDVTALASRVGAATVKRLESAYADLANKSATAKAAAVGLSDGLPIPEINSESWQLMMRYAREFATSVFADATSPQIATGGICVLCQQNLDSSATDRLAKFDAFIAGRAVQERSEAEATLAGEKVAALGVSVRHQREIEALLASYIGLGKEATDLTDAIFALYEAIRARCAAIQEAIKSDNVADLAKILPMPEELLDTIAAEIDRLRQQAQSLYATARDEEFFTKLTQQREELLDRKRLSQVLDTVIERRNLVEKSIQLQACVNECGTRAVTRQITTQRRETLTPSLKDALESELNRLELTHLPVNLVDRGREAQSIVQISLSAHERIRRRSEILSEGEQRALALACFLAELKEIGHNHAIIVDDPVSSLDHERMRSVAERLAEEAENGRQVIIFTHSILFYSMIGAELRKKKIPEHSVFMRSAGKIRSGIIEDSQKPWQSKKVKERVSDISMSISQLLRNGYDSDNPKYKDSITSLYTKMRETWERGIEEVLFNTVVERFRPDVGTLKLRGASFDPESDYPPIFEGMKRTSHFSGHDHASDLPPHLPKPDEIKADLEAIKSYFDIADKRRKKLEGETPDKPTKPIFI